MHFWPFWKKSIFFEILVIFEIFGDFLFESECLRDVKTEYFPTLFISKNIKSGDIPNAFQYQSIQKIKSGQTPILK